VITPDWCKREVLPLLPRGYRPRPSLLGLACVEWCVLQGMVLTASRLSRERFAAGLNTR